MAGRPLTPADQERIRNLAAAGMTVGAVARMIGKPLPTVKGWIDRHADEIAQIKSELQPMESEEDDLTFLFEKSVEKLKIMVATQDLKVADLVKIMQVAFDRRQVVRAQPTSITGNLYGNNGPGLQPGEVKDLISAFRDLTTPVIVTSEEGSGGDQP